LIGSLGVDASAFVQPMHQCRCSDAVYCEPPLFAVADGVDHADGSGERVLEQVLRLLRRTAGQRDLRAALHAGNWAVWYDDPTTERSCATVTIVRWEHDRLLLGHVGDSRAYLVRDNSTRQLTVDHMAGAAASRRPSGRTARLGRQQAHVPVDIEVVEIAAGDRLLLCTDGLWQRFSLSDVAALVSGPVDEAVARLQVVAGTAHEDASAVLVAFREVW
jgi:serine/threonine protein phosphatase PrpC